MKVSEVQISLSWRVLYQSMLMSSVSTHAIVLGWNTLHFQSRACERSWAVRISAPRSRGCSLPRSTTQSRTRSLRSILLPAHLQFHPAPVKSLHARSNLKLLCMPKTCRFQPKPYAWDTLSAWQTWSRFVAWLLRKKSASLLFYSVVDTWYARIPQEVLPDWVGCRPNGILLIGLDRRITHWAGRPNLGCF